MHFHVPAHICIFGKQKAHCKRWSSVSAEAFAQKRSQNIHKHQSQEHKQRWAFLLIQRFSFSHHFDLAAHCSLSAALSSFLSLLFLLFTAQCCGFVSRPGERQAHGSCASNNYYIGGRTWVMMFGLNAVSVLRGYVCWWHCSNTSY